MSRRPTITGGRNKSRRVTYTWIAAMAAAVIALLYWEQTALLYVLATLGVTALLVVVAVADLSGKQKASDGPPAPADDSAAIGSGLASNAPPAAASSARARAKRL